MPILPPTTTLYPVEKFGLGGLNSFDEPASIENIELADVKNMVFDDGILKNRQGSLLTLAALELGSELVVNGSFSGGTTGWTLQTL